MPAPCPPPAVVPSFLQPPPLALRCPHSITMVCSLAPAINCLGSCWGHKICRAPAARSCFSPMPQFPLGIKKGGHSRRSSLLVLSLSRVPGGDGKAQSRNTDGLAQGSQWDAWDRNFFLGKTSHFPRQRGGRCHLRPALLSLPCLGRVYTPWGGVWVSCTGQEHTPLQK